MALANAAASIVVEKIGTSQVSLEELQDKAQVHPEATLNRLQLLKTLAPGFLPLLVFIAADALWGTKVGLVVAVASGLVELAVSYARERTWDRFVLLDTLLIVAMGGISLLLENDIFFRLKPAIVELVFCLVLGISVYSPVNIMLAMSRRYLKGMALGEEQARAMTRSMKTLFFIFLGHTALIVYAAFAMSAAAWGFISGGLVLHPVRRLFPRGVAAQPPAAPGAAQADSMPARNGSTSSTPRARCAARRRAASAIAQRAAAPGRPPACAQLRRTDFFCRSARRTKQIQPGKWDTAVGGHVSSGENDRGGPEKGGRGGTGLERISRPWPWPATSGRAISSPNWFTCSSPGATAAAHQPRGDQRGEVLEDQQDQGSPGKGILTPNFEFEFDILLKQVFKEG